MFYVIEKYTVNKKGKSLTKFEIGEFKLLSQLEKKLSEGPKHENGKLIAAQELWYGIQVSITDLIAERRKEERELEKEEKDIRRQLRINRDLNRDNYQYEKP